MLEEVFSVVALSSRWSLMMALALHALPGIAAGLQASCLSAVFFCGVVYMLLWQ